MAILTYLIIFGYFLVRVLISFSNFEDTHSEYMTAFWKACLACGSFAVGSLSYLSELSAYCPGTWCLPPISAWVFLGWLVVVVVDLLYQFRTLGRTRSKPANRMELENGATSKVHF